MADKREGYSLNTFHLDQQVVVEITEPNIVIRGVIQRVAYDSTYDHERYNIVETAPHEGRHWVSVSWKHIHDKLAYDLKLKNEQLEQQLTQARDIIRRLYGSFRWDTHTDQQEMACKDAETFLDLPPDKRRDWGDGE